MDITKLNIALAHDSLTQFGGAERVLEAIHEIFPKASVFTLVLDKKFKEKYCNWDIRSSFLQNIYNFFPKLQYFLPIIPFAVSSLDFSKYDLVFSLSSGFIKNIQVPKNCIHVNYCHTPARFLWSEPGYIKQEAPFLLRPAAKFCVKFLKKWDFAGAQRVNFFIANSLEVQNRISIFYHRESKIIYPFIDTSFWKLTTRKKDYFLLAGRLQPHKNNELVVKIFNRINLPLHIAGTGRQEKFLKFIAKKNIKFLGKISDQELRDEYSGAIGFIYPQIEDFGLMPLEAAACGTATLANAKAGSLETVIPKVTGELVTDLNFESLKNSVLNWNYNQFEYAKLRSHAENFNKNKFIRDIKNFLQEI